MAAFHFFADWSFASILRQRLSKSNGKPGVARRGQRPALKVEALEDRLTPAKVSVAGGLLDATRLLDSTSVGGLLSDPITGSSSHAPQQTASVASASNSPAYHAATTLSGGATGPNATTTPSTTSPTSSTTSHSSTAAADYLIASASFYSSPSSGGVTARWSPAPSGIVAPTNLTAAAQNTSEITLNWQYSGSGISGFKIYRSTDKVNYSRVATVGAGVLTYANTGLNPGTTYYYEVKAYIYHVSSSVASNVASDVARGVATHFQVTASSASVTAGTAFSFTADALDSYDHVAVGYRGTSTFSSSDGNAALPANYTYSSSDLGVHSFSATLKTAGSQSLTVTDTASSSITGTQSGITVNPAAASTLAVSGFPTAATAGTAYNFTATAHDAYGNTATGYTGTVAFSSSDAQAALPANYTFTSADAGVHTFSATLKTVGAQSITATDTSNSSINGTQSGITVSAASTGTSSADPLVISGLASIQTAGSASSFTVTATDASGHVVTGYTGTVTFSSSDSQAVLPANYTFTSADQGVHTFNVTFKTAGTQSLTVTDTANTSNTATQSGITVNAAAASSLTIAGFPSPATAGTAGTFTVTAKDAYGNVAGGYTGTVKFSSSDALAGMPSNYTFTGADAGVHSFSATLNTVGTQSITATDTATATVNGTQSNITVNAVVTVASSPSLQITGFPTSLNAGVAGTFTVTALNANGTVNTGYRGTVDFASSSQSASLPSAYTFTAADLGVHTFTATLNMAGTQSITAIDTATAGMTGTLSGINVTLVQGNTYYVSTSGADSNAGTLSSPFRTLNHAVSLLKPGDTLYIRGGTYTESLDDAIPGGTSWSAPVTIAAYSGETVTLQPPSGSNFALHFSSSASQYIIVSGLHIDATNVIYAAVKITDNGASSANHIRLINDEIKNVPASSGTAAKIGVLITAGSTSALNANYNELINTSVHDIGGVNGAGNNQEGIYIQSDYNLLDGVETYNCSSYGLQIYDDGGPTDGTVCSNNIVRDSKFHNDAIATGSGSGEVLVGMGQNNLLYNNFIYNGLGGCKISYGATGTMFLDNTVYGNSNYNYGGLLVDSAAGGYGAASGTIVENNILYLNGVDYSNSGINTTSDYNLTGDNTAVGAHSKSNTNPLFVNATAATPDFHLQSTSPAIGAGNASSLVPVDAAGNTRPQGAAYCIGAYEYV